MPVVLAAPAKRFMGQHLEVNYVCHLPEIEFPADGLVIVRLSGAF
jgi:hypothetical protein